MLVCQQQVGDQGKAGAEMVSSMHLEDSPLSLSEAASAIRRRCTSECLTNSTDASGQGGGPVSYTHLTLPTNHRV